MDFLSDISDEEFIPFLNGLGIDTYKKSFEWMLNDPDFSDVLRWIYNCIDENNALTDREQYRYAEIEKQGKIASEEELGRDIASLLQEYPGICLPGDKTSQEDVEFDLKSQKERLAMLEKHEAILGDLVRQNELTNDELNVEINKLNAALMQCNEDEASIKKDCVTLAENVESITNDVINEVGQLLHTFESCRSNKRVAKRFFAFGPYETYHQNQVSFKSFCDMFLSKMISKAERDHTSHNDVQQAYEKALDMEERFSDIIDYFIDTKGELAGEQAKLAVIKSFVNVHPSQIPLALVEAKSKQKMLVLADQHLEDDVMNATKDYVERRTSLAVDVGSRASLAIREELLKDMNLLTRHVCDALTLDRVLYGALRVELGDLQKAMYFGDQLRTHLQTDAADRHVRYNTMTYIQAELDAMELDTAAPNKILEAVTRALGGPPTRDEAAPLRLYDDLRSETAQLRATVTELLRSKEDNLQEGLRSVSSLTGHVYDGCTRRAGCHERGAAAVEHALRQSLRQVDDRVLETTSLFNTVKNGDPQNLRKLWQWFLADPGRLRAALRHSQTS